MPQHSTENAKTTAELFRVSTRPRLDSAFHSLFCHFCIQPV